jgi:fructosamine-3-kinase
MQQPALADIARSVHAITGLWLKTTPLAGGDIASVMLVTAENGQYVLKNHVAPPQGFFASESEGLASLANRGVRVPQVFATSEQYLLLEYLRPQQRSGSYFAAGEMLARLHLQPCASYGAPKDNYLATLLQPNGEFTDWAEFFLTRRLKFCLSQLRNLSAEENKRWGKFAQNVRPLLASCPQPSWLHGDLWAGNLLMSVHGPVFIDPACYAGDALVDIAMTHLFGGFSQQFYDGYRSLMPTREHEGELIRIYQIYPLLVHALLFDGADSRSSHYYRRAQGLRDVFL